jgi:hypothetical protein
MKQNEFFFQLVRGGLGSAMLQLAKAHQPAGQQRPFFNSHQDLPRSLKKNTTFKSISKGKSTIWQTVPGFLLNVSMHEYFTYYFEMGKEINWLFYFP